MSFRFFVFIILAITVIMVPGCAKKSQYKPQSLSHLIPPAQKDASSLTVRTKVLTKAEAHTLFDGRAGRLLRKRKPIFPLLLTIENSSAQTYCLDPKQIPIKLVDPRIVANRLHSHTNRRVIGTLLLGAAGATASLFGAAYLTIIGAITGMPAVIKAGYATLGICGFFVIGSPIISYQQGSYWSSFNEQLTQDLLNKSLIKPLLIHPRQSYSLLLFIHSSCRNSRFPLVFIDRETSKTISFDIDLSQRGRKPIPSVRVDGAKRMETSPLIPYGDSIEANGLKNQGVSK